MELRRNGYSIILFIVNCIINLILEIYLIYAKPIK